MKLIPPSAPVREGELAVSQSTVVGSLRHGILSGCVICGHTAVTYWPHENRFHPLHESCVPRLLEHWRELLEVGEEPEAPRPVPARVAAGSRGAYGRRAAKIAGNAVLPPSSPALAPVIPAAVQDNPYWRPGNDPDQPWLAVTETNIGRLVVVATSEANALETLSRYRLAVVGPIAYCGAVLAPDQSLHATWGGGVDLSGPARFSTLTALGSWVRCRGCDRWRWPGCWVERATGRCVDCDPHSGEEVRVWPEEPDASGGREEPPPPPKKLKARAKAESFD